MPQAHLLLVEDDLLSRTMFADWLTEFGYRVTVAASAEEALARLESSAGALDSSGSFGERIELVVTDLVLPRRDGISLVREVRQRDPEVDVIVVTALEQVAPAVQALKAGAADYLTKPFGRDALELTVSRCLAARRLVRDNQALREQVALFERGRRLSATLDPAELWPLALSTLSEALGAQAGVVATLDAQGTAAIMAEVQLPEGRGRELLDRLGPHLRTLIGGEGEPRTRLLAPSELPGTQLLREDTQAVALVPCAHQGQVRSAAALLLPKATTSAWTLERTAYLARHVGLAQANSTRFAQAEELAFTDDLTGLRNDRALRHEIDRLLINRPGVPFALLFLDLDKFKGINDSRGHLVGSRVLAEVGRVLRGCVRDGDVAARYGGDEFAVVLGGADSGEALKVAERIRRAVAERPFAEGTQLTVCIGVACYPEHLVGEPGPAASREALLALADQAMYRGKRGGRNVVYLAEK